MATTFESEMMSKCCGKDGRPDFEKMKEFMRECGKMELSDEHIEMVKQFCGTEERPDCDAMKRLFEECGCSCK